MSTSPIGSTWTPAPGCHAQVLTVAEHPPVIRENEVEPRRWSLTCPCCGAFDLREERPTDVRVCVWCLRHGHGPNWTGAAS